MKEKIFDTLLGIVMIILVIIGILIWFGLWTVLIMDEYHKNPNTLFISIPVIILLHVCGYLTIKHTRL